MSIIEGLVLFFFEENPYFKYYIFLKIPRIKSLIKIVIISENQNYLFLINRKKLLMKSDIMVHSIYIFTTKTCVVYFKYSTKQTYLLCFVNSS